MIDTVAIIIAMSRNKVQLCMEIWRGCGWNCKLTTIRFDQFFLNTHYTYHIYKRGYNSKKALWALKLHSIKKANIKSYCITLKKVNEVCEYVTLAWVIRKYWKRVIATGTRYRQYFAEQFSMCELVLVAHLCICLWYMHSQARWS